jgi:hypothetical protein
MLTRLAFLAAALLLATLAVTGSADARDRWKFRYYTYDPEYDFYYGPEYLPEPRYYRYLRRDRSVDLYDDEDDYEDYAYQPDYYEPDYAPPRKRKTYVKPPAALPLKKKPTSISCAKAGEIISGYGFKSVEQVTCKGQFYAFNATRDGKPFTIKLNSASGELTEVKKVK